MLYNKILVLVKKYVHRIFRFSDCSLYAAVHGFEKRFYLPHEGRQPADDGRHGGGARAAPYEAEELPGSAGAGRSELRGGALHRLHQELATHR